MFMCICLATQYEINLKLSSIVLIPESTKLHNYINNMGRLINVCFYSSIKFGFFFLNWFALSSLLECILK